MKTHNVDELLSTKTDIIKENSHVSTVSLSTLVSSGVRLVTEQILQEVLLRSLSLVLKYLRTADVADLL